jgi:hypothetical protein
MRSRQVEGMFAWEGLGNDRYLCEDWRQQPQSANLTPVASSASVETVLVKQCLALVDDSGICLSQGMAI